MYIYILFGCYRYHNSRLIKECADIKFEFEGDRCSLIISSVRPSLQGTYRCKAVNSAGDAISSCKLIIVQSTKRMYSIHSYLSVIH